MSNKRLVCDQSKCTGCYSCQVWCSFHHFAECNPSLARLAVIPLDEGSFLLITCRHCRDPLCMKKCPADAIKRDAETNAVVIIAELCNGCQACVDACAYMIKVGPHGEVFKCDLCGGNPVCVQNCTRQALKYVERAEPLR